MDKNLGKKVPGSVFVSCNYIYTKINESVSNRATIFDVCVLLCGKGKEKRRKKEEKGRRNVLVCPVEWQERNAARNIRFD